MQIIPTANATTLTATNGNRTTNFAILQPNQCATGKVLGQKLGNPFTLTEGHSKINIVLILGNLAIKYYRSILELFMKFK